MSKGRRAFYICWWIGLTFGMLAGTQLLPNDIRLGVLLGAGYTGLMLTVTLTFMFERSLDETPRKDSN